MTREDCCASCCHPGLTCDLTGRGLVLRPVAKDDSGRRTPTGCGLPAGGPAPRPGCSCRSCVAARLAGRSQPLSTETLKGRVASRSTTDEGAGGVMDGSWSATNPDTTPGAVCAELSSCNASGHSVRCPRGVATVTIDQIVAADVSPPASSTTQKDF